MKFAFIFLLMPFCVGAQQSNSINPCTEVVEFPDVEATFLGGAAALQRYIIDNWEDVGEDHPNDWSGKIQLSFIVNCDGTVTPDNSARENDSKMSQSETNLILKMPNWKPAENDGKPVKSVVRLPVYINLE